MSGSIEEYRIIRKYIMYVRDVGTALVRHDESYTDINVSAYLYTISINMTRGRTPSECAEHLIELREASSLML